MLDQSPILTFSGRVYALLLLAYPTRFRRAYGREMAQVFRDDIRGTFQESGTAGLVGLWFLVLFDLLKTAFAEHIWEVFHMPMEKLDRWTGFAAALGGALNLFLTLRLSDSLTNRNEFGVLATFSIAMFLMWAIALAGLYRRLPAASQPGNKIALSMVLISLLLSVIGLLILPVTEFGLTVALFGYVGMGLGVAAMGMAALRSRALGIWSFTPLLIAIAWLVFIVLFRQDYSLESPIQLAFALLVGIGWLLLGIGLWTSTEEDAGPALPA